MRKSKRNNQKQKRKTKSADIISFGKGESWFYSDLVKEYFLRPKNFLLEKDEKRLKFNGMGMIGSPACGDVMRIWLYIDPQTERIKKCLWRTFGCCSAIASTSAMSVMVTEKGGMKVDRALALRPQDIMKRLGGLPARKIHCSVLGDKALRLAIGDYFRRAGKPDRIPETGEKIVDKVLKITDRDIEEAVRGGAKTLKEVQKITKVGYGDKACLPHAEELVRFYAEKYA